jgi:hypothetical protein
VGRYDQLADFTRLRDIVEVGCAANRSAAEIADDLNRAGFHPASGRVDQFTPGLASELINRLGLSPTRRPAVQLGVNE